MFANKLGRHRRVVLTGSAVVALSGAGTAVVLAASASGQSPTQNTFSVFSAPPKAWPVNTGVTPATGSLYAATFGQNEVFVSKSADGVVCITDVIVNGPAGGSCGNMSDLATGSADSFIAAQMPRLGDYALLVPDGVTSVTFTGGGRSPLASVPVTNNVAAYTSTAATGVHFTYGGTQEVARLSGVPTTG